MQVNGDTHPEGPLYPEPPHCPYCETVPALGLTDGALEADVGLDGGGATEVGLDGGAADVGFAGGGGGAAEAAAPP